jgi:hypothetical protein
MKKWTGIAALALTLPAATQHGRPRSAAGEIGPLRDRDGNLLSPGGLKDGRALLGRVATRSGTKYTIKTRDGKLVAIDASEIAPKILTKTNSPAL